MPDPTPAGAMPRDNIFRSAPPERIELRSSPTGAMPTLTGHFSVFNTWTEINSIYEGHFLERFAPGAFKKTFQENLAGMRVLFQHGQDPQIGDKVLGPIEAVREDKIGAYYEVPLLDTSYNRDLLPGLQAGLYGASFRFSVLREEKIVSPARSAYNPTGLPERTVVEARVREFGPVTFGAYPEATAGVRSLTDDFLLGPLLDDQERLEQLLAARKTGGAKILVPRSIDLGEQAEPENGGGGEQHDQHDDQREAEAPGTDGGAGQGEEPGHPVDGEPRRDTSEQTTPNTKETTTVMQTIDELRARLGEIETRFAEINQEAGTDSLSDAQRGEWNALTSERSELAARVADYESRQAFLQTLSTSDRHVETERTARDATSLGGRRKASRVPDDVFKLEEYRFLSTTMDEYHGALTDGALRALEIGTVANDQVDETAAKTTVERLLRSKDTADRELASRILITGSPVYLRAFGKALANAPLSPEEQRALSLTGSAGGYAVPYTLDPTVILTSNGAVNPLRMISRVETIVGNTWYGVSSAGITASYGAEVTEASDNAPTLAQPTLNVEKAQAFVPFSIEVGEDWANMQADLARLLVDAKDTLEADKFLTGAGHGSQEPQGLLVGATAVVTTAATATFAIADLYSVTDALPSRFQPRASIIANRKQFSRVRQFDTAGGAGFWTNLGNGTPPRLLDYPTYEASGMTSAFTTGSSALTVGDFSQFLIVDRVGMNIELIPHMFATANNRPSGQRGFYAYWRNSSQVLAWQAFRTLKGL